MPTYEYVCESCGNQYEKREGFDAKPRQKCPACGKTAQRMLSVPAVVFKGTGFYKTDSRGASSATADAAPVTPSPPPATDGGHTHGPGGHTHDTPKTDAPKADASKSDKPATTTTESAAAS